MVVIAVALFAFGTKHFLWIVKPLLQQRTSTNICSRNLVMTLCTIFSMMISMIYKSSNNIHHATKRGNVKLFQSIDQLVEQRYKINTRANNVFIEPFVNFSEPGIVFEKTPHQMGDNSIENIFGLQVKFKRWLPSEPIISRWYNWWSILHCILICLIGLKESFWMPTWKILKSLWWGPAQYPKR